MEKERKNMPKDGEKRVLHKFLIFPYCIGDEYRWLEFVYILQWYAEVYIIDDTICGGHWVDEEYLTAEDAARYECKNRYWKRLSLFQFFLLIYV